MKSLIFLVLMSLTLHSQITVSVSRLPADTPQGAAVYMASDLNNWNPKDENFKLLPDANGRYSLTIPADKLQQVQAIEYKFTLGSWDRFEGDAAGNAVPNRRLNLTNAHPATDHQILSWTVPVPKISTATGDVRVLSSNFTIPQLGTTRRIWIYLPKSYSTGNKRYPVMYMQDGQNLFDDAVAANGEWMVDETLQKLSAAGDPEAIIIGIDNGGDQRLNEYSPWINAKYGGGKGDQYADFLALTLKPFIDKNYRTLRQAKYTGLIGSSMGGLISFYTGLKYPEKFGRLGIFSPSFWFSKNDLKFYINKNSKKILNTRFYFLAGEKESPEMVSDIREIVPMLEQKGVPEANIHMKFDAYGTHSEHYWSEEFGAAYEWLMLH